MKIHTKLILIIILFGTLSSCFEDRDDNGIFASEINDFVWKGMNAAYLYKDNTPDLANDRFTSDQEYGDYLNSFTEPESLFESVIYQRTSVDKYSWITDDYIALEQFFSGHGNSNGMAFVLRNVPGSETDLYGLVVYILPDSNASDLNIQRGTVFNAVDGTLLTETNFAHLISNDTYSIDLATYNDNGTPETEDDTIDSGTETITLTKQPYTKNPIFRTNVLEVDGENVGYLMYNGFTANFDDQLNAAFGNFAANNVQHLVLDLRYNPGGSVNTSILLSSMITGQFSGEIYSTEQWNSELQASFHAQNPESLINRFTDNDDGASLNSLNLTKVYVLTTGSSASASELVINCLNPYIDVVQIGTTTTGKYQASITLYDSSNFNREGANPNHTYAIQPLVLKSLNSVGFTDYDNGLPPDILLEEDVTNFGVLGNENEPLLAAALNDISGASRSNINQIQPVKLIGDSNDFIPFGKEMYIDRDIPEDVISNYQNN